LEARTWQQVPSTVPHAALCSANAFSPPPPAHRPTPPKDVDLREATAEAARDVRVDLPSLIARGYDDTSAIQGLFGSACYIDMSWPSVLFLAHKHADSFEDAVLANTNAGGENCHRGAALGALMGAALGERAIPARYKDGLAASADIKHEVDAFVDRVFGSGGGAAAGSAAAAKSEL
jgi:ADP-ribosyl-[dinitrogen reductase] hydrolase